MGIATGQLTVIILCCVLGGAIGYIAGDILCSMLRNKDRAEDEDEPTRDDIFNALICMVLINGDAAEFCEKLDRIRREMEILENNVSDNPGAYSAAIGEARPSAGAGIDKKQ